VKSEKVNLNHLISEKVNFEMIGKVKYYPTVVNFSFSLYYVFGFVYAQLLRQVKPG